MGESEVKDKKDKKDKREKKEEKSKEKKDKKDKDKKDKKHKKDVVVNPEEVKAKISKSDNIKIKEKKKKEKLKAAALEFLDGKLKEAENKEEKKKEKATKLKKDNEKVEDEDDEMGDAIVIPQGDRILVPFAHPLANGKLSKKIFKTVKKSAKAKCLKRGVKEVVKALRKSTVSNSGVVILAADISPIDVISHIPVLCEDHNIPYVFVSSRAELGAAGGTKRPTSVVMIVPGLGKGKKPKKEGEGKEDKKGDDDLMEAYDELIKAVESLPRMV